MRKRVLVALALGQAAPALADPSPPSPRPSCAVTIVRAPERVRRDIEKWVQSETRCTGTIELRVIPTEGGFYLFARDDQGRVRERLVPDAPGIGVLVASWIADDAPARSVPASPVIPPLARPGGAASAPGLVGTSAKPAGEAGGNLAVEAQPSSRSEPNTVVQQPATQVPTVVGTRALPAIAPPGVVSATRPLSDLTATHEPTRWMAIGGAMSVMGYRGYGLRGAFDVFRHRMFVIGMVAQLQDRSTAPDQLETSFSGAVFIAGVLSIGAWQGRAQLASGVNVLRDIDYYVDVVNLVQREVDWQRRPLAEVSLEVSRSLDARWALTAGPVFSSNLTRRRQHQDRENTDRSTLMMFAGLRYQL